MYLAVRSPKILVNLGKGMLRRSCVLVIPRAVSSLSIFHPMPV